MIMRKRMEALALEFFGSEWAEDSRVRGLVEGALQREEPDPELIEEDVKGSLGDLAPETLLRLVLDTIPAAVFWKDREFRFVGGNRTFANDIGLNDAADAVGLDDYQIAEEDLADEYRAIDRDVMDNGTSVTRHREPQLRDGELAWLETNKIPLHDPHGEVVGLLGTYADVTGQVLHEEALNSANSKLAQASRFKDQFLAAVSHELRTPLNPILALTESLQSGVYGELDHRQNEALGHMAESAKQLHRLIEDILDISAFEFGGDIELVLAPTRTDELFRKMVNTISTKAAAKGIAIKIDDRTDLEGHFLIDSRRVEKALAVLLDNAVKFSPADGKITLAAEADLDTGKNPSERRGQRYRNLRRRSGEPLPDLRPARPRTGSRLQRCRHRARARQAHGRAARWQHRAGERARRRQQIHTQPADPDPLRRGPGKRLVNKLSHPKAIN